MISHFSWWQSGRPNLFSFHSPLPSITVNLTARQSKSFLFMCPLLSRSYRYPTRNLIRLSQEYWAIWRQSADLLGSKSDIINEGNDIVKIILSIFPSLNFSILIFYMNQPSICNIKHADHSGTGRLFFYGNWIFLYNLLLRLELILSRGSSRSVDLTDRIKMTITLLEEKKCKWYFVWGRSYRGNKSH